LKLVFWTWTAAILSLGFFMGIGHGFAELGLVSWTFSSHIIFLLQVDGSSKDLVLDLGLVLRFGLGRFQYIGFSMFNFV